MAGEGSAAAHEGARAEEDTARPSPLLPSALDRRICPEPVQARFPPAGPLNEHVHPLKLLTPVPARHVTIRLLAES